MVQENLHYIFRNHQSLNIQQENYFLREFIKKIFFFMDVQAIEWDICEHEYDDFPFQPKRCLKCNVFADEVEILMLCKEIIGKDLL